MKKLVKLAVASAVVLGVSVAMAGNPGTLALACAGSDLGLQDTTTPIVLGADCCVYDGQGDLVLGEVMDLNVSDDGNITMKCGVKKGVVQVFEQTSVIFDISNIDLQEDVNCTTVENIIIGTDAEGNEEINGTSVIDTEDYQNVVSATNNKIKKKATVATGNSSLVCKYPGRVTYKLFFFYL